MCAALLTFDFLISFLSVFLFSVSRFLCFSVSLFLCCGNYYTRTRMIVILA